MYLTEKMHCTLGSTSSLKQIFPYTWGKKKKEKEKPNKAKTWAWCQLTIFPQVLLRRPQPEWQRPRGEECFGEGRDSHPLPAGPGQSASRCGFLFPLPSCYDKLFLPSTYQQWRKKKEIIHWTELSILLHCFSNRKYWKKPNASVKRRTSNLLEGKKKK